MAVTNTAKDGSGTWHSLVADADGYLKVISQAGAGAGGVLVDDAAFTPGTSEVMVIGGQADETAPDSVDEGDAGAVRISLDRMLLVQTSGRAAEDAAVAGNPALMGGRYDSTPRTLDDGDVGAIAIDAAGNVQTELPAAAALADGATNPTSPIVGAAGLVFNGTTLDRARGNEELTLLASAARTATLQSSDQVNYCHAGIIIVVDISAITDTPVLTPYLQIKDSVSGNYVTIWTAAVALEAVDTIAYLFQPGGAAGSYTEAVNLRVGRTWRFGMTHADADEATYSVSAAMLV